MAFSKVLILLLDSAGAGALPDAAEYDSAGAATLPHILDATPDLKLPNLDRLGLSAALGRPSHAPEGVYCRCASMSRGKDSIVGHWEIMGVLTERPFETYPHGFPQELIDEFSARIGRGVLGNCVASGTEIIKQLGPEHQKTGFPIVYTSADSVFQIAAHEETVPVETLYSWCETARRMFDEKGIGLGRVIARPFVGMPGAYIRTPRRHDYATVPPTKSYLEVLAEHGVPAHSIGKPYDIFLGRGFFSTEKTTGNADGMEKTLAALREKTGLIFTNLVDFDMLWGHRRDTAGYAAGLKALDDFMPTLLETLGDGLLIITADHGCDPTYHGTDHTREYIPALFWHRGIAPRDAGIRKTFADVGATALAALGVPAPGPGIDVLKNLL